MINARGRFGWIRSDSRSRLDFATDRIRLSVSDIRLSVSDDGVGLPDDYAERGRGFAGMSRAQAERGGLIVVPRTGIDAACAVVCHYVP